MTINTLRNRREDLEIVVIKTGQEITLPMWDLERWGFPGFSRLKEARHWGKAKKKQTNRARNKDSFGSLSELDCLSLKQGSDVTEETLHYIFSKLVTMPPHFDRAPLFKGRGCLEAKERFISFIFRYTHYKKQDIFYLGSHCSAFQFFCHLCVKNR